MPHLPAIGVPNVSLHALGDFAAALLLAVPFALARPEGSLAAAGLVAGAVGGTVIALIQDRRGAAPAS